MDDNDGQHSRQTDRPTDHARTDAELIDLVVPAGRFMFALIRISVYGYAGLSLKSFVYCTATAFFLVFGALSIRLS